MGIPMLLPLLIPQAGCCQWVLWHARRGRVPQGCLIFLLAAQSAFEFGFDIQKKVGMRPHKPVSLSVQQVNQNNLIDRKSINSVDRREIDLVAH